MAEATAIPASLRQRFVERFQHLRAAAGKRPLSLRDLADLMAEHGSPRSHAYVRELLKGTSGPTLEDLAALSRIFGVPADYFVRDDAYAAVLNQQVADVNARLDREQLLEDLGIQEIAARGDLQNMNPEQLARLRTVIDAAVQMLVATEGRDQQ